ncbi:ectonucleoside triphosphate diphosphohydrolase 8 [Triplophysa dalaica]|uniref:ectonucleoside triphosphate diphosphohydrolase 8 n=1 Tax=Triplophysa dalaica TaxID=1582913 RepID=UPI0024DFA3DA|nr:ectonucleoside triphosphate diphosphohydrolase 8 [Triplophysa dalaica]XP_056607603.1 ectonucleoside triphosphate diphosphohydrolase 8 [Triplophysa dalaica]XP_056607604.1 ectonucleoside triphosphate diphosphohydrolase 8 [Triplophysa dalaica]
MGLQMKPILLGTAFAAVACMTIIALILSLANRQTLDHPYSEQYGIVFDAGSTHTSLFLYQWLGNKDNNTGIVSQKLSCDVDGDGISSYVKNPPAAGESLKKCLDVAKAAVPAENQKTTPVYLGATAGMRLLSLQNQSQADTILEEVTNTIQSYPFDFRGARILPGTEEGTYGWITINYLSERFIKHTFEGKWIHPKSAQILGALDLGGSSTQISFIPNVPVTVPESKFNLQLYGYKYEVYTHSYLCYGKDQAMRKLQVQLHKTAGSSFVIDHPCYHKGYKFNVTLDDLYNSPCVEKPNNFVPTTTITFTGTSNSSLCRSLMEDIVNVTGCKFSPDCGFNGVYQPPVNGEFFAFSAYFYTFEFFGLVPKAPLDKVHATINSHCSKSWIPLVAEYPKIKEKYLKDYCASAHYIMIILLDGYKFNNTWDKISFEKQVADTDVGWTLGYMLNLTNLIPSEPSRAITGVPNSQWPAQIFFIVFALFLSLLIIMFMFINNPKQ